MIKVNLMYKSSHRGLMFVVHGTHPIQALHKKRMKISLIDAVTVG